MQGQACPPTPPPNLGLVGGINLPVVHSWLLQLLPRAVHASLNLPAILCLCQHWVKISKHHMERHKVMHADNSNLCCSDLVMLVHRSEGHVRLGPPPPTLPLTYFPSLPAGPLSNCPPQQLISLLYLSAYPALLCVLSLAARRSVQFLNTDCSFCSLQTHTIIYLPYSMLAPI